MRKMSRLLGMAGMQMILSIHSVGVFTTTPLSTPDDQTRRFSERLAAAWYVYWNSPSHPMQGVYDTKKEISEYIISQYKKEAGGLTKNTYVKTNSNITGLE